MLPPRRLQDRLGSLTVAYERAAMRGHPGLQPVTSSWQSLWNTAHTGAPAPVQADRCFKHLVVAPRAASQCYLTAEGLVKSMAADPLPRLLR